MSGGFTKKHALLNADVFQASAKSYPLVHPGRDDSFSIAHVARTKAGSMKGKTALEAVALRADVHCFYVDKFNPRCLNWRRRGISSSAASKSNRILIMQSLFNTNTRSSAENVKNRFVNLLPDHPSCGDNFEKDVRPRPPLLVKDTRQSPQIKIQPEE